MSPAAKIAALTTFLLLSALAWIAYREAGLGRGLSEPEHRAALDALAERNRAMRDALLAAHKAELDELNSRLSRALSEAERERAALAETLDAEKKSKLRTAKASPGGLAAEVAAAAEALPGEVHADADTLWLARRAALSWLDKTLTLRRELDLAPKACALKLAARERELVPPLVAARQAVELRALDLDGQLRVALAERDYARRQALAGKGETLKWSLISGGVGLAVGTVAGGLGAAYLLKR